jgi:hypothetical protein
MKIKFILTLILTSLQGFLIAQSYNAQFARDIEFTEPFGVNHSNYYLYVEVNTSSLVTAGKMQADGDDIRFVADCGQNSYLDYFIHRGMNTSKTEIYVRVPQVDSAVTDTIQMLYGDNSASGVSNFNATFPNALITNGSNLTRGGVVEAGWVEIGSGDVLNITTNSVLELRAAYVEILGDINGVGDGFQAPSANYTNGTGPGGGLKTPGNNSGSGAGAYGGNGGRGGYDSQTGDPPGQGGSAYGSRTSMTIQKGSSGASGGTGSTPGDGGGAVILRSTKLILNGDINVNAGNTSGSAGQCAGGGAGGGVLIVADSVSVGSGASITARGSNGSSGASANDGGGGGGGGRIKIFRDTYLSTSPSMNVSGGSGGCCGNGASGAAGSSGSTYVTSQSMFSLSVGSEQSAAPFAIQATLDTVCPGVSTTLSVTNPGSVTWSNGANTNSITVTPSQSSTYYVFGTSSAGCNTSDTFNVIVDAPVVDLGPDTNNCGPISIDAGSETGTQYSWNTGASTSTITIQQTGTYHVTASRGGCSSRDTITMTIDTIPIVTLTLSDDSICRGDSVMLTGSPAGGTSNGTGLNGMVFSSQTLNAPAVYTQYYTFTDANGCFEHDTTQIFVQAIPVVTLTTPSNFSICIGDTASLNGTPAGGTYTGTGAAGPLFLSNLSGVGTFNVVYSFTDTVGCTAADSDSMVVHALPTPQLTIQDDTLCFGDNTVLSGTPLGGQFRGPGVLFNGFDSRTTGDGVFDLRYYYRDQFGCSAEDTLAIVVHALPSVSFSFGADTICEGTSTSLTPIPTGGTFSGTGVSGNTFDAAGIGVGFRTVTYDYTDQNGCSNTEQNRILIIAAPRNVSISSTIDSLCSGATTVLSGSPSGGVYAGAGVNDTIFDSQGLAVGLTKAFYTYTNSTGCSAMDSTEIWIHALPTAFISSSNESMCLGDSAVLSPDPVGGVISGMGVQDTMFYSDSSGIGTWTITYDYVDSNSCTAQATTQITVNSCAGLGENAVSLCKVFPNPSQGVFNVLSDKASLNLQLNDQQGKLIVELSMNAHDQKAIDLSDLASGIYFLNVTSDHDTQTLRLILK